MLNFITNGTWNITIQLGFIYILIIFIACPPNCKDGNCNEMSDLCLLCESGYFGGDCSKGVYYNNQLLKLMFKKNVWKN